MSPLPCAVEAPRHAEGPLRYALEELLAGLGRRPAWGRAADARIVVGPEVRPEAGRLALRVGEASWRALAAPVGAAADRLGWLDLGAERVPLPVGPTGMPAADPASVIEADVLGSAFWHLAGWEEHATPARNEYGRFAFGDSLAAQLGTPTAAPVDALRRWLGAALRGLGEATPGRTWAGAPWGVALTHDLDALRTRRLPAALADLAAARPARAAERALGPDARLESLRALADLARRHGARSTFFVKSGGTAPEDVPIRLAGRARHTLRTLASDGFEIGLHPSFFAHDAPARLADEHARLVRALGVRPTAVRSHYLRWTDPTTPRLYARAGFAVDSTLGWSATPGFRRGTCHPFRLWDASAGAATDLVEAPLALMDATLFHHLGLSDSEVGAAFDAVFETARREGGVAVVLWHNALADLPDWMRRLGLLDRALAQARADGAAVGSLRDLVGPHPPAAP